MVTSKKLQPFCSVGLFASFLRMFDLINSRAALFTYPYLLILAEKDAIVDNKGARAWHAKTSSRVKQIKLLVGTYHMPDKEPNNATYFESTLKFMGERLIGKAPGAAARPFGQFKQE